MLLIVAQRKDDVGFWNLEASGGVGMFVGDYLVVTARTPDSIRGLSAMSLFVCSGVRLSRTKAEDIFQCFAHARLTPQQRCDIKRLLGLA